MYEVEIKVELTAKERQKALEDFKTQGFIVKESTPQHDYYVEATPFDSNNYNIKRYRAQGSAFFYTEKHWEMLNGQAILKEMERELPKEEFEISVARYPKALTINKNREWFEAVHEGRSISVTIDTVQFDHSPYPRYFIEAEIGVENREEVPKTQVFLKEFLQLHLQRSEIVNAPGMFTMAFKKL